ncbi:rIIB protein [Acinetobacter phage nACB2]|nr:rIIB protein [Acinetobacter phage nACB2]
MAVKYTDAQKKDYAIKACKIIKSGGSINSAAKELGIANRTIKSWIEQYAPAEATDKDGKEVEVETTRKAKAKRQPAASTTRRKKAGGSKTTKPKQQKATTAEVGTEAQTTGSVELKVITLPNSTVIAIASQSHEVKKDHPRFNQINIFLSKVVDNVITEDQAKELENLIEGEQVTQLKTWSQGKLSIDNGVVRWDGKPLVGGLKEVMLRLAASGDTKRLKNFSAFIEKVRQCVSYKVNQRFFDFISKNSLQITEDGDIIAFKVVRHDYKDKHSGTFDNSVGKTVQMPRNEVDDQDTNTCSNGLHICSESYIKSFSSSNDRLVLVKVDPRDIVSIPTDYNSSKCRTCRYTVVKDVTDEWKAGKHIQYTDDYKFKA